MKTQIYQYCPNLTKYQRLETHKVSIGHTPLGAKKPIRIQTMTTTDTLDIDATVKQCKHIMNTGADYVRITTQGQREAKTIKKIKAELLKEGYHTPLIADVHFNPEVANTVAQYVEKVRINPGNYIDKIKKNTEKVLTDKEYQQALKEIEEKFSALIKICNEHNTAIRVGVNHGSLSDRIVTRYGNTPTGMVESCMEFLRIAHKLNFSQVVVSMKSSNTRIMVQAYRLLAHTMIKEKMNYPLHLGVTEAGDGENGRIKSAVGIGTLLVDGLGDTIRVSLSENPEEEIPVAKKIVEYIESRENHPKINKVDENIINPFEYNRRQTTAVNNIGGNNLPVVVISLRTPDKDTFYAVTKHKLKRNKWVPSQHTPEYVYIKDQEINFTIETDIKIICNYRIWKSQPNYFPLYPTLQEYLETEKKSTVLNFIKIQYKDLTSKNIDLFKQQQNIVLILESYNPNTVAEQRAASITAIKNELQHPIIFKRNYKEDELENLQLKAACDFGPLLTDGLGDGIWLYNKGYIEAVKVSQTLFGILQACKVRVTDTEYISCPSCGRTLFNLEETIQKVKKATQSQRHLKIAIMGCIVNGIGEMGDADYGYVGASKNNINLYRNKELVEKNIPETKAVEHLVNLIKENGDWKEAD